MRLLLALLVFSSIGCGVSPQPTPPPAIAVERLLITESAGGIRVQGVAGAISNATSMNVFKTPPFGYGAAGIPLEPDGSFDVSFEGTLESQLRLQAFEGDMSVDDRSDPLDVIGTPAAAAIPTPRFECMTLDVGSQIDFGSAPVGVSTTVVVTVRNNCTGPVDIAPAEIAIAPRADFVLTPLGEPSITPGEVSRFEITHQRAFAVSTHAFLVFGWGSASSEFRIITLFGRGE